MASHTPPSPGTRYLSVPLVCDKLSRKKTWLYDQIKADPTFPRPLRICGRMSFIEQDIDRWVMAQTGVGA